jgi:hypothetical protein
MTQEQKDLIIEAVEMARDGMITKNEMVAKIKDVAEIERYEETIA